MPELEISSDQLQTILTAVAWVVALPALGVVGYLCWRRFGPNRRHRRHRSRLARYLRE
jgi:hypothetical protein